MFKKKNKKCVGVWQLKISYHTPHIILAIPTFSYAPFILHLAENQLLFAHKDGGEHQDTSKGRTGNTVWELKPQRDTADSKLL